MKYLKTFERYESRDLGEEIAEDLFPRFQKMRREGMIITTDYFDKYMKDRGADFKLSDSVLQYLVGMGFDFDIDVDDDLDIEDSDFELKKIGESLRYSGGNVTKMPVIGQIKTKPIGDFEGTTYDVVEVTEDESGDKYYICNFWHKDGRVPQIVHEDMVEEFIEK